MSNIALSFEKDGSDGLTHNVQRGRKGTQNEIVRILGYQVLFLGRLPGDHFNNITVRSRLISAVTPTLLTKYSIQLYHCKN